MMHAVISKWVTHVFFLLLSRTLSWFQNQNKPQQIYSIFDNDIPEKHAHLSYNILKHEGYHKSGASTSFLWVLILDANFALINQKLFYLWHYICLNKSWPKSISAFNFFSKRIKPQHKLATTLNNFLFANEFSSSHLYQWKLASSWHCQ